MDTVMFSNADGCVSYDKINGGCVLFPGSISAHDSSQRST